MSNIIEMNATISDLKVKLSFEENYAEKLSAEVDELVVENDGLEARLSRMESYGRSLVDDKIIVQVQNDELIAANDGLEDQISVLKGALKAYEIETERGSCNRNRLARIEALARGRL